MTSLSLRQQALQKIAALSASSYTTSFDRSDLDRLCRATGKSKDVGANGSAGGQHASLARVPMTIREFEVLLSLCKAAPLVQSSQSAQKLVSQLVPYVLDAHAQTFQLSPFFRNIEPSPIEALSFNLIAALLSLGTHYNNLHETVSDAIWSFLGSLNTAIQGIVPANPDEDAEHSIEDAIRTATIAIAILGFLDAAAAQASFWKTGGRLALVQRVRALLSQNFLTAVDGAFSVIRNSHTSDRHAKEWKRYLRHYAHQGRPLGPLLLERSFMWLMTSATSLLIADAKALKNMHILDLFMAKGGHLTPTVPDADFRSIELYAGFAQEEMDRLEASADFLQLSAPTQRSLACAVKSCAIISYLNCSMLNEDAAEPEVLLYWLTEALEDTAGMADETLASTVLRALAIICRISPTSGPGIVKMLPRFIVQASPSSATVAMAAKCLAFALQLLSHDAVISTLYTLGNVLSPNPEETAVNGINGDVPSDEAGVGNVYQGRKSTASEISLELKGEDESTTVCCNIVQAICGIASVCNDEKITALAQAMLLQKLTKVNPVVDARIIIGAATLSLHGGQLEFRSLLKSYSRICRLALQEDSVIVLKAVMGARNYISAHVRRNSPLFQIYWEHILEEVVSRGDVHQSNHPKETDFEFAAREIEQLIQPLSVFMSTHEVAADRAFEDDDSHSLVRDAWFNMVVHGFNSTTPRGKRVLDDLRIMAIHSPPLVAEQRGEQIESDIELNTVLRRANTSEREAKQKQQLGELVPSKAQEIRALSYRKVIFLQASYLVESLRAESGDCTKVLSYFLEPSMQKEDVSNVMIGITSSIVELYLAKTLAGREPTFSAQYAAAQLAAIFCACCHRIKRVQLAAVECADRIVREVPSALCQRSSLFALLELLSLMWTSCLEAETDMYEPRSTFSSKLGNVTVELSDDYEFRRITLNSLYKKAKSWVALVIDLAPSDVKGLLQTYLSEYSDDGAYGHLSLGRSFAVEMGSSVPSTDQRLTSLEAVGDTRVNNASDFIASYTTRQEYRYGEALPDQGGDLFNIMPLARRASFIRTAPTDRTDAVAALTHVESRLNETKRTPLSDVRDILRRAAALLCRSEKDESAVAHSLVSIPFKIFSKESIKFGVSLWLGVMNENPRMEPRLLAEIAQQWEATIQKKLGLFNPAMMHPDPFFLKEEFAPSDNEALAHKRQQVHNLLAPHTRLVQFFVSHFNATRLGSVDTQRTFLRLLDLTMDAMRESASHPMARELRLRIVLFSLRVLRVSSTTGNLAQLRFKDKILSAALSWFKYSPKWSFGSNLLQLKTEVRLISDVMQGLKAVAQISGQTSGNYKSIGQKEALLEILLQSEQARLGVWIRPTHEDRHQRPEIMNKHGRETSLKPLVRVAWNEDPSLAIELVNRFPLPSVHHDVRWLLLNFPAKAMHDPEALPILLGSELPHDVRFQLKYLLFWAPVNPITAVTYFLPAYRKHPFLTQYAMRALESHSIDVTFFYVPQIVQALRHDALGYVERYIVETAQFSQLFAHQIIWNMKANMYKDDDGTIPDTIKPSLDKVMAKMISSFSDEDKDFYEREFSFFDEVTSISGKLKPYIQRPKPEKKLKIDEELRKIKVEIGVYLPSNPDGVVVGIDRKSGRPLQSHAKAPYMATFRIQKTRQGVEETEAAVAELTENGEAALENTYEIWQSAIFKVGDDCRQDVLALQMISAFRGIFHNVGLDVYVFPYRVTATAPGCGVIDVLPGSISRDMLGREAVNGLYDYFISKYGNEDSLRFQKARMSFVKSMAAYSIISFLLQFKDRHNGNIMIDEAGHIIHIDFGFCFDIAPGGVKFERAPFKLTGEMLAVMGGSMDHQAFKCFEELCVKAFLASRPYAEKLSQIVSLMMDSGLPCFKPESIKHFRERFVLEKNEREAAEFVRDLVKKSAGNYSTVVYDQFQLMTNGIPY
ncbi:phosphatidylinositol 3 [Microdochium trichocladiopsis]|uniref:1-phosphatidylinositol 4-kinase n=1 Tax=Microdochium trichocladiopsis TaxID=1682393 RepID=A0A9P9BSL0_9PEZI|nr:phosphatidylinositol 3 [Microdochium trichocladiopsis]KAH7034920.1 phosphatidylinositol 3 [Microdochium trichocladiopsis]